MEEFKIEIFLKENPGRCFPEYKTLSKGECDEILRKIVKAFRLKNAYGFEVLSELNMEYKISNSHNAIDDKFNLTNFFQWLAIEPFESVYVNWHRFDRINSFKFNDLNDNFDYIWYPSSDDIEIFDESFKWMVFIAHGGDIGFLLSDRQGPV